VIGHHCGQGVNPWLLPLRPLSRIANLKLRDQVCVALWHATHHDHLGKRQTKYRLCQALREPRQGPTEHLLPTKYARTNVSVNAIAPTSGDELAKIND
jgi:hypothetical protein